MRSSRYPPLLADLAVHVATGLVDEGVAPDKAAGLGCDAAEYVRLKWAGKTVYIPSGGPMQRSKRDMAIYRDLVAGDATGAELAVRHGVTERRIWQILQAARAAQSDSQE